MVGAPKWLVTKSQTDRLLTGVQYSRAHDDQTRTEPRPNVSSIASVRHCACLPRCFRTPHPDHKNDVHPPYQVDRKVSKPEIFAEGTISTVDDEMGSAFSPDGTEFYFSKFVPYTTAPRFALMCVSRFRAGRWSAPEALPFSGKYLDYPPKFDPTGKRMVFASSRPLPDGTRGAIRIWEVERNDLG